MARSFGEWKIALEPLDIDGMAIRLSFCLLFLFIAAFSVSIAFALYLRDKISPEGEEQIRRPSADTGTPQNPADTLTLT